MPINVPNSAALTSVRMPSRAGVALANIGLFSLPRLKADSATEGQFFLRFKLILVNVTAEKMARQRRGLRCAIPFIQKLFVICWLQPNSFQQYCVGHL